MGHAKKSQEQYLYFEPGTFWTPEWDFANEQPRDVTDVLKPNGRYHHFKSFVSEAEADAYLRATQPADKQGERA